MNCRVCGEPTRKHQLCDIVYCLEAFERPFNMIKYKINTNPTDDLLDQARDILDTSLKVCKACQHTFEEHEEVEHALNCIRELGISEDQFEDHRYRSDEIAYSLPKMVKALKEASK